MKLTKRELVELKELIHKELGGIETLRQLNMANAAFAKEREAFFRQVGRRLKIPAGILFTVDKTTGIVSTQGVTNGSM